MKTKIYCIISDKGIHSFYLQHNSKRFYLFSQNYRKGVHKYYKNGVSLEDAINFNKSHRDEAVTHTMEKLPAYIKYIEKEYDIAVYKKTKVKNNKRTSPRVFRDFGCDADYLLAYGA